MVELAINVIIWSCVVVFILSSIITLLALVGLVTLGGGNGRQHNYYLKNLFRFLMLEVITIGVGAFGVHLNVNSEYLEGLTNQITLTEKIIATDSLYSSLTADTETVVEVSDFNNGQDQNHDDLENTAAPTENLIASYDTLEASVYATSDGPNTNTAMIHIPKGWQFVQYYPRETTRNGDSKTSLNVDLIRSEDEISAVKITVSAEDRNLFGPRNWIGAVLKVIIKKET